ncbi:MAG: AraC family transcriptional regulator [Gammaproteobacteria bacterium]|nr:AraC family transcriptional regulator [Gammaproteobacteria bacterium]
MATSNRHLSGIRHLVYGLNPLITLLRARGVAVEPLLSAANLKSHALTNPEYEITPAQELTFTGLALDALQSPGIGLEMGPRYHLSAYGVLGLAIMTSANLKQALQTVFDNVMLTWTYFGLQLRAERDVATFTMARERDLGRCFRYMCDRGLSATYTIFTEALGERLPLRRASFMHERPDALQPYDALFGCPIAFCAPANELVFDEAWLYRPLAQSEASTHRIFAEQCRRISSRLGTGGGFAEIVRYNLVRDVAEICSLDQLADKMSLTARTVQRKLAQEHTSFKQLLEEVRRNLALEYLANSRLAVADIAARLGYSDAAGFNHAFRRWLGCPPGTYRRQAAATAQRHQEETT